MTLTSQRKTQIVEEQVNAMLKRVKQRADVFNEDGAMVGDITMPGPQRLDKYWAVTPDLTDVPLLTDPNWELRIKNGLDNPPVNPYWKNLLRVPGLLKSTAADFVRLNALYADRYQVADTRTPVGPGMGDAFRGIQGGTNAIPSGASTQAAPLPAGGGLPLPMAPAPGPPQPGAGGNPGSAGPYQPGMMP